MSSTALLLSLLIPHPPVAPIVDIPFEVTGGRIYVDAQVGSKRVPIILDSGAGATLIDSGLAKEIGAKTTGEIPVGGAGQQTEKGQLLDNVFVALEGGKAKAGVLLGLNLRPLSTFEGRTIYGILGSNLFNNYVVQVDYPAKRVRLYEPSGYQYSGQGKSVAMKLVNMLPVISMEVEIAGLGSKKIDSMIDTGASGALSFTAKFERAQKLDQVLPKTPAAPLTGGVGGLAMGRMARIGAATVAGHRLLQPVSTITLSSGGVTGAGANYDCLVGAELLRRFVVTFDYSRKQIWFDPTAALSEPFAADHAGLLLKAEGLNYDEFVVHGVVPESPAEEAGIKAGDTLTHINHSALQGLTLDALRQRFRTGKEPWTITLRRGTSTLDVTVKPRPLV